jgi:hypothetical protein
MPSGPTPTLPNSRKHRPDSSKPFSPPEPPDRLLLIDSDIFILLAGANALEAALGEFGFEIAQARRLDALEHMLRSSKKLRKSHAPDVIARSLESCGRVAPIQGSAPDPDLVQLLADTPDIDSGEVALLSHLVRNDSHFLASGDKRWMRALCAQERLAGIRAAVAGRVICLEVIVESLLNLWGIDRLIQVFAPVRTSHTTLKVLFGGGQIDERNCRDGIRAHLEELESQVGPGFLLRL